MALRAVVLGSAVSAVLGCPADALALLNFNVDQGTFNGDTGRYNAAVNAMTAVVNRYNAYGDFGNYNIYVFYNAGIPTAQANYEGSIGFGGTYPNERVAEHESNHFLGSGTYWNWGNLFNNGVWTGPRVSQLIQQFNGDGEVLHQAGVHFYDYGLNYDSEVTTATTFMRNVAIMYAMRADMGNGNTANPWSATNVTLTGSDAAGTSAFNWFGGGLAGDYKGWSDKYFAHAGAAYSTGAYDIRTPQGYPSWTFAGDSLTVASGGRLLFNGYGTDGVVRFKSLILDGGTVRHDQYAQDLFQLAGPVTLASTSTFEAANGNIAVLGVIGGNGGLVKTGNYTTTLNAANTFTGGTTVNSGTLALNAGGTAGSLRGSLTVNSGAVASLTAADALGTGDTTSVTQINLNGGTLDNAVAGNNGYNASVTLNAGTMTSSGGGAFQFNAAAGRSVSSLANATPSTINANVVVRGNNAALPINVADGSAANDLVISGAIRSGTGEASGISKNGAGVLLLTGANAYTGATNVNAGTLTFASAASNIGAVTVADAGTLRAVTLGTNRPTVTSTAFNIGNGTLALDLGSLDLTTPLITTGTLTATGTANVLIQNGGGLSTGSHLLLGYSSFTGGGTFAPTTVMLTPRSVGTLVNNAAAGGLSINVVADRPVWTGADNVNWAANLNGTLKNWKLQTAGLATDYLQGDNVLFDDTAVGSTAVSITGGNVTPAAVFFNNTAKNYTVSSAGGFGIGGTGTLTKNGTGTVTISTANTYSGGTTVNAGRLVAANATALGTGDLTLSNAAVGNSVSTTVGGALTVNGTSTLGYAGQNGDLTIAGGLAGNGTLTNFVGSASNYNVFFRGDTSKFTGTINYTSNTGAGTGWWRFGTDNTLVDLRNAALVLNKGNVTDLGAPSKNVGFTDGISGATLNVGSLSGNGVFQASFASGGMNTLVVGFSNASTTFSGSIAGGNAGTGLNFTKVGTGTLTLTGTSYYTGATAINGGTVVANSNAAFGGDAATLSINGATLTSTATNVFVNTHGLAIGGNGATLNILGNGSASSGEGARMVVNQNNGLTGNGALTINGAGTLAGTTPNATDDGTGVLVLNGSNNYSGTLTLQNGAVIESAGGGALGSATVNLGRESELAVTNGSYVGNTVNVTGSSNAVLGFTNAAGNQGGAVNLNANTLTVALRNWYNYAGVQNGTIGGVISGTGGLLVNSGTSATPGTLTLGAVNVFSGNVDINNANVNAGSDIGYVYTGSNLGTLVPTNARSINVNAGSTLTFTGGNVLGSGGSNNTLSNVTLNLNNATFQTGLNGTGGGWWNKVGKLYLNNAAVHVGSGANNSNFQALALIGTVTVAGNAASTIDAFVASDATSNGVHLGQNNTAGQVISFNVGDATGNAAADLIVSARLINTSANMTASGLAKTGAGTMLLSGTNSYTGGTTVSAGTLVADNNAALGAGRVTLTGGTLAVGAGRNVAGLTGLTLASGSTLAFGGAGSELTLASGLFSIGNVVIDLNNAFSTAGIYTLVDGVNGANALGNVTLAGTTAGYAYKVALAGNDAVLTVSNSAVPEPTALAAIAMLGGLALRRRRVSSPTRPVVQ